MPKHYVYILRSLADQQFYVGLTSNLLSDCKHTTRVLSARLRDADRLS